MARDVVIAGGAVYGSAVAYWLAADPDFDGTVTAVERDPTYARAASALSASSIRQQFSSRVNIRASLESVAFLREIGTRLAVPGEAPPAIGLHEGGYLFVASDRGSAVLDANGAVQREEGADIVLMDREALAARFPFLSVEGLAASGPAGAFGRSGEGWFDGWGLLQAFRAAARAKGVRFVHGEVAGVERAGDRVTAVRLADGARLPCGSFVNCAGAAGGRAVARMCGFDPPVVARKRCVFGFACPDRVEGLPLLVDVSGVYVRPEGDGFICGVSPDDLAAVEAGEDEADDFDVDWPLFEERIWPALAARVPAFERLRPGRAWAGHYDVNAFDHNALLGRVPGTANAYLALGFSGHGIQGAPALARALAGLVARGRSELDVSDLSPERLLTGRKLIERNVI